MNNRGRSSAFVLIIIGIIIVVAGFYCGTALKEMIGLGYNPSEIVNEAINSVSDKISDVIPGGGDGDDAAYMSRDENICKIRDAMISRQSDIVVKFRDSDADYIENGEQFYTDYMDAAMSEDYATGCYSGDYLANTIKSYRCSIKRVGTRYEVSINVEYRDDAAQEQTVDAVIKEVIAKLGLGEMNEGDRVKAIYRFITNYVEYDEMAYQSSLDGNPDDIAHTAYGALINGQAVCQGFACLFYALCKNAGLDARIVSGTADNGREAGEHAWNMVKIDGTWYWFDVTWDTCLKSPNWRYFRISEEQMGRDHFKK